LKKIYTGSSKGNRPPTKFATGGGRRYRLPGSCPWH